MNFVQATNGCFINLDNVTRVQFEKEGAKVSFGAMLGDGSTPDFYYLPGDDARALRAFLSGEYKDLLTRLQEEQEAEE